MPPPARLGCRRTLIMSRVGLGGLGGLAAWVRVFRFLIGRIVASDEGKEFVIDIGHGDTIPCCGRLTRLRLHNARVEQGLGMDGSTYATQIALDGNDRRAI